MRINYNLQYHRESQINEPLPPLNTVPDHVRVPLIPCAGQAGDEARHPKCWEWGQRLKQPCGADAATAAAPGLLRRFFETVVSLHNQCASKG